MWKFLKKLSRKFSRIGAIDMRPFWKGVFNIQKRINRKLPNQSLDVQDGRIDMEIRFTKKGKLNGKISTQ